ncbi:MAG TPA: DUF3606 domain-containing protein [Burkholderiales bacterium]|nr:DUF3606 domain-containing protein [Burkholderiales bacterium]
MIFAYAIILLVTILWSYAAGTGALRDTPAQSRRAHLLREDARRHHQRRGPLDTFRDPRSSPVIFASEHWQQRWWCEKLDVTTEALRAAMREVGPMTADIQIHFARKNRRRATVH